ncbi:MAG: glycosyltransferase [Micromonosporaceae bacterium]|nr:glycosyltransferase [Micromonosporaceae bacterium]
MAGTSGTGLHLVVVSTFPPRRCGLASYTSDLSSALRRVVPHWQVDVCAIDRDGLAYPDEIIRIRQDEPRDYIRAADAIAGRGADLVLIQHEFGIFGGPGGAYVLGLADRLGEHGIPYAVTLHTVLAEYTPEQSAALRPLCTNAALVTVFTETARRMVIDAALTPASRVVMVPHGAPEVLRAAVDPAHLRPDVAAAIEAGRDTTTLSTFGLIGPGKGLEVMLRALPRIVDRHPQVRYLIAGATHPEEVRLHGERYRRSLVDLAEQLGVGAHVEFLDAFLTETELAALLAATDIYVTPYRGPEQICSGALTFAVAAGRPVVSTAYRYACDLLSAAPGQDAPGLIVECDNDAALADAVVALLDDPERRRRAQQAADALGRQLTWPAVAARLAEILETTKVGRGTRAEPAVRLDHLARLVDPGGIIQFAHGDVPDRASGSCVDDVARLGIVTAGIVTAGLVPQAERAHRWLDLTVDFLRDAVGPGGLRNMRDLDGTWRDEPHLGDHVGRAIWGLGVISASAAPQAARAGQLLRELLVFVPALTTPRSLAYALLGLARVARPSREHRDVLAEAARRLDAMRATAPGWNWYEDELTYDNARLPQSLIAAGAALGDHAMVRRAVARLDWYLGQVGLTGPHPVLRCVGNHWRRSGEPVLADEGDEQPLDAAAVVEALAEAWLVTRTPRYARLAHRSRAWFHGLNRAGRALYDPASGGCHDGLKAHDVNPNMGAESTLAFHQAHLALVRAGLVRAPRTRSSDAHPTFAPTMAPAARHGAVSSPATSVQSSATSMEAPATSMEAPATSR